MRKIYKYNYWFDVLETGPYKDRTIRGVAFEDPDYIIALIQADEFFERTYGTKYELVRDIRRAFGTTETVSIAKLNAAYLISDPEAYDTDPE